MSKLYLQASVADISISNPVKVYGANGGESVAVNHLARLVVLDQNIEQVNLQGLASAYTFQQVGNQLRILSDNALVLTVAVQDDGNGTLVRFGDGTMAAISMSSQGIMTLGGATVSATAGSVNPENTGIPAGAIAGIGSTSGAPQGKLYLESGDPTIAISNPLYVYGSSGATDNIQITEGITDVVCDQNIEQLNLPSAKSAYTFQQGGNQLKVYQGTGLVASLPVQDDSDGSLLGFIDGLFQAKLSMTGLMMLGGTTISSGTPTPDTSLLSKAQAQSLVNVAIGSPLASSDPIVVGMLSGALIKWTSSSLSYSFPKIMPADYASKVNISANWSPLNAVEQSAVRSAFAKLTEIVPLHFTEISNGIGDLRFSVVDQTGSSGFAISPVENRSFASGQEGDVFLATSNRTNSSVSSYQPKDGGFSTVLHEIGHAVGLKHPFESPVVPPDTDNNDYSIMSYTEARNMNADFTKNGNFLNVSYTWKSLPDSYALYDIAGLQALYGANTQTRIGDSIYSVSSANNEYLCIWDAGGNDTIDAASATGSSKVNLNSGTFSTIDLWPLEQQKAVTLAEMGQGFSGFINSAYDKHSANLYTGENNLSIAYGVVIENVNTGSGNDIIIDNKYNNKIISGAGDDVIELGMGGFDMVDGGAGFDTVRFANVSRSQIQQELQDDGGLLLLGTTFAARLIGIESVVCSDGALILFRPML